MTENEIFYALFSGGNISLPYLLKFTSDTTSDNPVVLRFVNNNEDIVLDGETFKASTFQYTKPDMSGNGANLSISGNDTGLIEFADIASSKWSLEVKGVICADGSVQRISQFLHFYGTVSYSDNEEMSFELGNDDRGEMTFPSYSYDTDNNLGNA